MPILMTIPLQLLAYDVAVRRGCDVDQPQESREERDGRIRRLVTPAVWIIRTNGLFPMGSAVALRLLPVARVTRGAAAVAARGRAKIAAEVEVRSVAAPRQGLAESSR